MARSHRGTAFAFLVVSATFAACSTPDHAPQGTASPPVAALAAPATAGVGVAFTLSGASSAAAPPATIAAYRWSSLTASLPGLALGTVVETTAPEFVVAVTPSGPPAGSYVFELVVVDSGGRVSNPSRATVVIVDGARPTAVLRAPAQVAAGSAFTLDGAGSSDVGGAVVRWEFTNVDCADDAVFPVGSTVTSATPTVLVPRPDGASFPPGRCTFGLVAVDDSGNRSLEQRAQVVILDLTRPTAVLQAPAQAAAGSAFTLDGASSTDVWGTVVSWEFTNVDCAGDARFPVGGTLSTTNPTLVVPGAGAASFTPGRCTFGLVVVDASGNRSLEQRAQVVILDLARPTAVLRAPSRAGAGSAFSLDGASSSDAGGAVVRWEFSNVDCAGDARFPVGGTLSSASPTLLVPGPGAASFALGRCTFSLVVVDDSGNVSAPSQAQVVILDLTQPTAVLQAPAQAAAGSAFTLDGASSSDVWGTVVSWEFTNVDCAGDARFPVGGTLSTTSPTLLVPGPGAASFALGRCTFSLVVVDDSGNLSAPSQAQVLVLDLAQPTAVLLAPSPVDAGAPFTLDGASSSDVWGTVVSWSFTNVDCAGDARFPVGGTLSTTSPTLLVPGPGAASFALGRCTFSLVVVDDSGNLSAPSQAQVLVVDRTAPTAVLDAPAVAPVGSTLTLSGARSSDPWPGTIVEYRWSMVGSAAVVTTTTPTYSIAPPSGGFTPGVVTFELQVVDDSGNVSPKATATTVLR